MNYKFLSLLNPVILLNHLWFQPFVNIGYARLIRNHSSAKFSFEIGGIQINIVF